MFDETALTSDYTLDRIISTFEGNTTQHSVAAATLSGGVYLPKTDILTIPNPTGKKAFPTMHYSWDGVNFYPQKYRLYNPGNPIPTGALQAGVGMSVSASSITFYFVHYVGETMNFTMLWTLDEIV